MSEQRNRRNRSRRELRDFHSASIGFGLTPWSTARALRAERRVPLQAAYAAWPASKGEAAWLASDIRRLALQQGEDIRAKQRARADG